MHSYRPGARPRQCPQCCNGVRPCNAAAGHTDIVHDCHQAGCRCHSDPGDGEAPAEECGANAGTADGLPPSLASDPDHPHASEGPNSDEGLRGWYEDEDATAHDGSGRSPGHGGSLTAIRDRVEAVDGGQPSEGWWSAHGGDQEGTQR